MSVRADVVALPPGGTKLEVRTVRLPDPGPFEVVVEQRAAGVCHSQLGHIEFADPGRPLLLGHESFGVVTAIGAEVRHVGVGDEVFITWIPRSTERRPQPVRVPFENGEEALTRNVFAWATHALADEQYVVKAATALPAEVGAIIGCAVMTGAGAVLNSARVKAGESVAVWGVGGVGQVAVAAARAAGAAPVIAVDIDDAKLDLAKSMGADHLVNALAIDPVGEIRRVTPSDAHVGGVDFSLDCTGLAANVANSLAAVRPGVPGGDEGGTDVLVGVIRGPFELSGIDLLNGQKSVKGCLGGASVPDRDFETFERWYADGLLDLDRLVTNRYRLDQANEALQDLRDGKVRGRAVIEL